MRMLLRSHAECRPFVWAATRTEFERALPGAGVAAVALQELGAEDAEWLGTAFAWGTPPCAVVTPLSLTSVQRFRVLDPRRFHAVWAEEARERLPVVLEELQVQCNNPLRVFGEEVVRRSRLHPLVKDAVSHICDLPLGLSPPPPELYVHAVPGPRIGQARRCRAHGVPAPAESWATVRRHRLREALGVGFPAPRGARAKASAKILQLDGP